MYTVLVTDLGKTFVIVDQPARAYLTSGALTDASSAVPVLRSISVVVPQARAVSYQDGGNRDLCVRRFRSGRLEG